MPDRTLKRVPITNILFDKTEMAVSNVLLLTSGFFGVFLLSWLVVFVKC